jgi:hypothetical protein
MEDYYILEDPISLVVCKNIAKYKYELMDFKSHKEVSFQVWCYSDNGDFMGHFSG